MQQTKNVERSGKLDRPPTPNKPIQKHLRQSGKLNRTSTRNDSCHKAPCEIKVESSIAHPLACLSYSDVKRHESKRHAPRFFRKRHKLGRRPVTNVESSIAHPLACLSQIHCRTHPHSPIDPHKTPCSFRVSNSTATDYKIIDT